MWADSSVRHAAKGQLSDKGHKEQREGELSSSGNQKRGASSLGPRDGLQGPGEA